MTDKELLERLKKMYIDESAKLRRAKLEKEKAAARRAVEVLGEVIDWIEREHAPKGELVEVVRCKDCKFYTFKPQQTSRVTSVQRCNRSAIICTKPDDYCSFGERTEK